MRKKNSNAAQFLEKLFTECWPNFDIRKDLTSANFTFRESEELYSKIENFHRSLLELPSSTILLIWIEFQTKDKTFGIRQLDLLANLLEEKIFPPRKNMTVEEIANIDFDSIVSSIRSHGRWFLQKREEYVSFFVEFINSLAQITHGLISPIDDQDRCITMRRKVPFETYVELLSLLPSREAILTKLFYLGGERALEEVLNLEIKNLDFKNNKINFPKCSVSYPQHVLEDIKAYIEGRKKGFIFIGKQGEKINHTVPYRALKSAALKIGFPSNFTFKDLIKEH